MESVRAGLMSRSFLSDAEQQRPGRQARIRNSVSVVSLALFGWAFLAVLEFQQTNQPQPNLPAAPSRFKQGTGLREMQVSNRRSSHELPNGWAEPKQPSQPNLQQIERADCIHYGVRQICICIIRKSRRPQCRFSCQKKKLNKDIDRRS